VLVVLFNQQSSCGFLSWIVMRITEIGGK